MLLLKHILPSELRLLLFLGLSVLFFFFTLCFPFCFLCSFAFGLWGSLLSAAGCKIVRRGLLVICRNVLFASLVFEFLEDFA